MGRGAGLSASTAADAPGLDGSTHMKKQWAAVRTHCASMMVPPQMWMGPNCTLTCQGHLLTEVSFPPMIRPEILCPQAGGESRAESRAQRGGKLEGDAHYVPTTHRHQWCSVVYRGQWRPWESILCSFPLPRKFAGKRPICPTLCKERRKALPSPCLASAALGLAPCQPAPLLVHRRETYFPVRHCELWERRGRRSISPGPAAPEHGQGQEVTLPRTC